MAVTNKERRTVQRWGEEGQVGGAEVLPFGFLVMVVGMLLVINAWSIVDAKSATVGAAQSATRTLVEGSGVDGSMKDAARSAMAAQGRDAARVGVEAVVGEGFGRCHRVGVRVTYDVALIKVPLVGSFGRGCRSRAPITNWSTPSGPAWRGRSTVLSDRLQRRSADSGTVLLLMPSALIVVMILAAIAFDIAAIHHAQRRLLTAAGAAANDAATAGYDEAALRSGEGLTLDPARVRRVVAASIGAQNLPYALAAEPIVRTDPAGLRVEVVLAADVPRLFAGAVPGAPDTARVSARRSAVAVER